jgi:hypothetical protein
MPDPYFSGLMNLMELKLPANPGTINNPCTIVLKHLREIACLGLTAERDKWKRILVKLSGALSGLRKMI